MKMELDSSIKNTGGLWEAFEDKEISLSPERVEHPLVFPETMPLGDETLLAVAIELGALVSHDGVVIIGVTVMGQRRVLHIDSLSIDNSYTSIDLARSVWVDIDNQPEDRITKSDIEITDSIITYCSDSALWIMKRSTGYHISLSKGRYSEASYPNMVALTQFAIERVSNPLATVPAELLPVHFPIEDDKRVSFVERLNEQVKANSKLLAIQDDNSYRALTYQELWDISSSVAQYLFGSMITQYAHPRIALFMERGWQHLTSIVAIQRLGGTCVLIDPSNPDSRVKSLLDDSQPDAVIFAGSTGSRIDILEKFITIDFEEAALEAALSTDYKIFTWSDTTNKDCFIAGTSGSTGRPKSVRLSYKGMMTTIDAIIDATGIDTGVHGSWLSSPGYGMVEVDPLPVLTVGGTVFIPSNETLSDPKQLASWFLSQQIHHTLLMTSMAEALWENNDAVSLNSMIIAGERCKRWPPEHINYQVLNVYGSAEAAVVAIEQLTDVKVTNLPSVGRTVCGANAYVLDRNGIELPAGCVGELVITGQTLSEGYIDQEQTSKVFTPNLLDGSSEIQYSTGDRARMLMCGTIEIFGRNDRTVKVRGYRIDLTEIEIVALEISGVIKAAAVYTQDELGSSLTLYLELKNNNNDLIQVVKQHIKDTLSPAAMPNNFVSCTLPLGANGKVDYKSLSDIVVEQQLPAEHDGKYFTPQNNIERTVFSYWSKWTRSENSSETSSFFDVGGDSLKAMRMIGELSCDHDFHIEMKHFLGAPTLRNLIDLTFDSSRSRLPKLQHLPENGQYEPFDLNESQQALWVGRGGDFSYGGVGCQGYFEWEVKDLRYPEFAAAVESIIVRHPMLRMTIDAKGQQRIGRIEDIDPSLAVKFVDLTMLSTDSRHNEIDIIREKFSNEEIGTGTWPLFNFLVSKIDDVNYRVHFNIDMLIADAWSIFQVVIPDLIDFYSDKSNDLPQLQTTFCDYIAYRREVIKSERYQEDKKYWEDKIKSLPPAPKLPTLEGTNSSNYHFDRHHGCLSMEQWDSLQSYARSINISPSGAVGLALCEVIRQWNEEQHFTLNFPVSDRMPVSEDIDHVVGDFTNTLLVPYETDTNDTLAERGEKLQSAIWDALDHRLFTGVEVLRELARLKRSGSTPLMPIVLTSLLGHPGRHDAAKLGPEVYGVSQTPQVTLDVQLRESEGVLYFKWDYLKGVIREDVIQDMFDAFCSLLERMATSTSIWSESHIDLRPVKQCQVRDAVNATECLVPSVHLKELLEQQIEQRGKQVALISPDKSYTWEEAGIAARNVGADINAVVEDSEKMVGIILPKGIYQYVAVYSCLLLGLGYVPIDPDLPIERMKNIFGKADVKTIVTLKGMDVPDNVKCISIDVNDARIWSASTNVLECRRNLEDYSPYIIFTSGSTGEPKGVEIPEYAVVNHILDVVDRFELNNSTRHLATAALHFDMSVFDVFGPLVHGGSVVVPNAAAGPDPDQWLSLQRRFEVNFWACVPAIMDLLVTVHEMSGSEAAISSLRNIVMAGDWIPLSLLPRARALYPQSTLYSCGGPTETTNWSILHEITEHEGTVVSSVLYGTPMRNSKYHIVSSGWQDCPDWVPGEMLVESDVSLAKGYIGQTELTSKAFVIHPRTEKRMYRTGDLGRYLPDGEIEILGRIDNQIKINGLRVELGEIENVALRCPGVERACAFALLDKAQRPKNIALAYLGEAEQDESIRGEIQKYLPTYMVPSFVQHVDELPLSKNSKVDIHALRQLMKQDREISMSTNKKNYMRAVIGSVSEHIGTPVVLPDDNFLDIGGDSISAMKIKIQLENDFATEIDLDKILMSESISDIAKVLENVNS
ncbi:non-ribosomal peptide synthetase [Vibrio mangrovi]|uniref:Gramicidin S synthase 2 n=1 Tax=Vibrio mangrovi TaxID=474394 RepID=A0A1Y6IT75_9VIBR|nr:non-ribosomal peptide synthetase [Vibrio mangrovi]MDW6003514.1 non-ribosomal peptide synthetase [Vibrio mangrovi]SMR99692.1 Gramicidin S synthase 2 [Vibrio mangrovi]